MTQYPQKHIWVISTGEETDVAGNAMLLQRIVRDYPVHVHINFIHAFSDVFEHMYYMSNDMIDDRRHQYDAVVIDGRFQQTKPEIDEGRFIDTVVKFHNVTPNFHIEAAYKALQQGMDNPEVCNEARLAIIAKAIAKLLPDKVPVIILTPEREKFEGMDIPRVHVYPPVKPGTLTTYKPLERRIKAACEISGRRPRVPGRDHPGTTIQYLDRARHPFGDPPRRG